ncbi:Stp1/IreP family PP2C-type Ser/Thr phosphatase [Nitrosovibrio sp. Nv17]|jgi:protein phosphatase|uniref:Stp1/IreP family PP2C-type Ser/Thr phosphatase n=1 Tax=Nitrosovibrio sp. Nv17 TaxID=1855339 RepID=UPI000908C49F|nr:Stp1/IreP family PP2C-type Ser/Thr phosphatase [Nitrosovibrio sp. Nv17]SFW29049.1 protein phosphatase [Nitrosovibrio sp. Nv17]
MRARGEIRLHSAGATHLGLRRDNNEDAYLAMPGFGLFALADGMGGAAAGEVASRYFIETTQALFEGQARLSAAGLPALVQEIFDRSNARIFEHARRHPDDCGMGCTGDLLLFHRERYVIGHVGDSRIYLLRDGDLRQLTRDHSLVQLQVDRGVITAEEARVHPKKNILLRALGTDSHAFCDTHEGVGRSGDLFLMCSDGLTDMVHDSMIRDVLASEESIRQKVENLIQAALAAGGRDNVTVILCEMEAAASSGGHSA